MLAVDIDSTFLEEVKAISPQVDTLQADITSYEPEHSKYDFIYVRLVLMHFTHADNQMVINKLTNALKSGGHLFIEDFVDGKNPSRFCEFARIDSRLPEYAKELHRQVAGHIDFDQGYRLAGMLAGAGLVNVESDISMKRFQGGSTYADVSLGQSLRALV